MSLVLATRALGIAGFAASLSAPYCLRPPLSHADEKSQRLMAYFGRGVYLTVQTNAVNLVYFTVSLSATLTGWASLQSATDAGFPLAFALGSLLTPLYYSADHFNPMHVERNRQHKEKGFRWCELADHVEHAHATPLLLLEACVAGVAPSSRTWVIATTSGFALSYMGLTLINRRLTSVWTYPLLEAPSIY